MVAGRANYRKAKAGEDACSLARDATNTNTMLCDVTCVTHRRNYHMKGSHNMDR